MEQLTKIIFALLVLSSCGPYIPDTPVVVDPRAEQAYALVVELYAFYNAYLDDRGLTVKVETLDNPDTAGVCKTSLSNPVITLSKEYWLDKGTTDEDREQLLLHEIGHCIHGMHHVENPFAPGIMSMRVLNRAYYKRNRILILDAHFAQVRANGRREF